MREDVNERKVEILDLYSGNNSMKFISELMECDYSVIKKILERSKIKIGNNKNGI